MWLYYNLFGVIPFPLQFMKKYLYLLPLSLLVLSLSGCFGPANDVAKMDFVVHDATGDSTLVVVPDYSKRTFQLNFIKPSADKIQSAPLTGQMGGEYFDRFQTSVKFVKDYKAPVDVANEIPLNKTTFKVVLEGTDKKETDMQVLWDDSTKGVGDLESFYTEVVKLLTESAPV